MLGDLQGLMSGHCGAPGEIYASDIVGLQLNAASNPPSAAGVAADRREISFGLLGPHAVSMTYRAGSATRTQRVLPGLGAYLIVQLYTSGRPLDSISETLGHDGPGSHSSPASPNGALTAITYRYAGKLCTDTGRGSILRSCGLSEGPPPSPAALPVTHEPLRVHLRIHRHVITAVEVSFPAPYPVTSARQGYYVWARACGALGVPGPDADVARGATVHIPLGGLLSEAKACARTLKLEVEYTREINALLEPTRIGTVTVHEPRARTPCRCRGGAACRDDAEGAGFVHAVRSER